jgi:Tannase-like family of unknown function (DUF6351)
MKLLSIRSTLSLASGLCLTALLAACNLNDNAATPEPAPTPAPAPVALQLEVLSSKAEYVTGGSALVRTSLANASATTVTVNDKTVAATFTPEAGSTTTAIALLSGLAVGANTVVATQGASTGTLTLTNYPLEGPVLSGPRQTPFICQTQDFTLPDGTKFGAATDGTTCTAPTVVQYVYVKTGTTAFVPMASTTAIPADAATTTTTLGVTVPFVVRVETATVDRGIYQSAFLHNPVTGAAPTPATPPAGWNKRVVAIHGFGCTGGWYLQGAAQGNLSAGVAGGFHAELLDRERLGEGYALFTNTLQHPSVNCNSVLQAEAAMMSKERLVKTLGKPVYTVSHGCSGGSYSSSQLADQMPGLFDGILIACTFPDPMSIAIEGSHGHLLSHYFNATAPTALTDPQQVAVTGYKSTAAFLAAANQSGRTDPVAGRVDVAGYVSGSMPAAVAAGLRYDANLNPAGARATVYDAQRNIMGRDALTGFALRPFDNVGVQYGLNALRSGAITKTQFLDLNERIGGYDQDANYVTGRTVGSTAAIQRAYQSGLQYGGNGGTGSIPVFDVSGIYNEDGGYHYQWFHFANRQRLIDANGNADNHVMWRGNPVPYADAWVKFKVWMEAIAADTASGTARAKAIRNKPTTDGCYNAAGTFVAEAQTFSSQPNSSCNTLLPSYGASQLVAGGPISAGILKCQLKPVTAADYGTVAFTLAEATRLNAIFPNGVCDWTKPGVGQVPVVTYASFAPSPVNLVFDITK